MSFWNPAKMDADVQMQLDKRVILGIAKDKLTKDLERVEKKLKAHRDKYTSIDVYSITRKARASMNTRGDNLAFERNEILRRLELIKNELEG